MNYKRRQIQQNINLILQLIYSLTIIFHHYYCIGLKTIKENIILISIKLKI